MCQYIITYNTLTMYHLNPLSIRLLNYTEVNIIVFINSLLYVYFSCSNTSYNLCQRICIM